MSKTFNITFNESAYLVPTGPTIPVAVATVKEDVVKQTNPRSAFWSAGVIQQFNGVKTPPIPKKTVRKEATPPAAQIIKDIGSNGQQLSFSCRNIAIEMY